MKLILIVATGSGIGGVLRYGMQLLVSRLYPFQFPLGTFSVNLIGCFLIGAFVGLAEKGNILSPETRLFLITGICGGFTTFSTFSYDNIALLKSGEWFFFLLYIFGSVILGLLATYLGLLLIKFL
jgi:fluoride exporter